MTFSNVLYIPLYKKIIGKKSFAVDNGDHSRSILGIICVRGPFAVLYSTNPHILNIEKRVSSLRVVRKWQTKKEIEKRVLTVHDAVPVGKNGLRNMLPKA